MLQTLFHIPVFLFQPPWMWIWMGVFLAMGIWESRRSSISEALMTWGIPVVGIYLFQAFVLPQVTDFGIDPGDPTNVIPLGLAVRGYGLMMLLGILAGVLLAIYRGRSEGLTPELVLSLAISLAVSGIIGARLFFVIQYWDTFAHLPFQTRLIEMVNMTKGGLVVFGSFIGASIAAVIWSRVHKVNAAKVADLIAPSFLVGLALGRIGCFLNGCCFGGYCDIPQVAVQFPAGSPPYERQIEDATLLGVATIEADSELQNTLNQSVFPELTIPDDMKMWRQVTRVDSGSTAQLLGVEVGDDICLRPVGIAPPGISFDKVLRAGTKGAQFPAPFVLYINDQSVQRVGWDMVPKVSQPIHPTQLYSFATATLLAIIIWISYRFRKFDGQSFVLMMLLYSIARYILEDIRTDEGGQFGTPFTISQLVAMGVFGLGILLMGWGLLKGKKQQAGEIKTAT